ncbi:MAG: hypothetical protein ACE5FI_15710 [Anaerolineales bacterium]
MDSYASAPRESWSRWARAFRVPPWRRQTQVVATLALAVVAFVALGGIYLAEASRAATAGRDVQALRAERDEMIRENEMLRAQIARHQSIGLLTERARQLGFVPATIDQLDFIAVPSYHSAEAAAPLPEKQSETPLASLPEYQESLGAWLLRQIPVLLGQGK